MSYCLNPNCRKQENPQENNFCQSCGSRLLLRERYRALRIIGQGGFGKTFLAVDEDKPSKPRCVIKQFLPQVQGANNIQHAARLFEQEAVRLDNLGKHSQMPELLAYFEQNGQLYIDTTRQVVIQPQFDFAKSFCEGLAWVKIGSKYGYIDTTGQLVIPAKFEEAERFYQGKARVKIKNKLLGLIPIGEKSRTIDKTGKFID